MNHHYITIGLAGHIDHGKTALTKALTGIETDRLKEEKQRHISIENGFAFFDINDRERVAVIDVPGHERFIRQMISGVAGIDLVLIVIAADEGIMPQTREHLTILKYLNIKEAFVVLTKVALVDKEWLDLVKEEVTGELKEKGFESTPIFEVDSIKEQGIAELKQAIIDQVGKIPSKNATEPFRLPVDDVFTLHGQGTIVRGTIFNGTVRENDELMLLPKALLVRVRQMQVHHESKKIAFASQRVAINLHGVTKSQVQRGDVLIAKDSYASTQRIDVLIETTNELRHKIKQRTEMMVHIGTAAVMGKLIFFDRNELNEGDAVYCQIELTEPVVTRRGDRLIVRRPSPVETVGGGWVIDAHAVRQRFGQQTVAQLKQSAQGTPSERLLMILQENVILNKQQWYSESGLMEEEFNQLIVQLILDDKVIPLEKNHYVHGEVLRATMDDLLGALNIYHEKYPLRYGMNKAEWLHQSEGHKEIGRIASLLLEEHGEVETEGPLVKQTSFTSHFPEKWRKRIETLIKDLDQQGLSVEKWQELCVKHQIDQSLIIDLKSYLIRTDLAYPMGEDFIVSRNAFEEAIKTLQNATQDEFTISEAKDILGLSRKYMIPFLELCDSLKLTERADQVRKWA